MMSVSHRTERLFVSFDSQSVLAFDMGINTTHPRFSFLMKSRAREKIRLACFSLPEDRRLAFCIHKKTAALNFTRVPRGMECAGQSRIALFAKLHALITVTLAKSKEDKENFPIRPEG